jgi:phage major head subunit gpT-like protein
MDMTLDNLRAAGVGFSAAYQQGFEKVKTHWQDIASEVPSTTSQNEYGWLGEFPSMREFLGERLIRKLKDHGYALTNRKFESTVGFNLDDLEDDNLGIYKNRFEGLGEAVARFPDELVFETVELGFSSNCYDGQNFFDTDHPVIGKDGKEKIASNLMNGAGTAAPYYLLDTSRALKPFIFQNRKKTELQAKTDINSDHVFNYDEVLYGAKRRCNAGFGFWQMAFADKGGLTPDNFAAAYTAMSSQTGDHGTKLAIKPNVLLVPSHYEDAANMLMNNDKLADNTPNPHKGKCRVVVSPWLSNEAL